MNLLAELHQEQDLKLNLKFEIEVLCKNLDIDVAMLKPAIYLKDPERLRKLEHQLSQPSKKEVNVIVQPPSQAQLVPIANIKESEIASTVSSNSPPTQSSTSPTASLTAPPDPKFSYVDIQLAGNAALQTHIMISPNIVLFQNQPQVRLSCFSRYFTILPPFFIFITYTM